MVNMLTNKAILIITRLWLPLSLHEQATLRLCIIVFGGVGPIFIYPLRLVRPPPLTRFLFLAGPTPMIEVFIFFASLSIVPKSLLVIIAQY